jgi:hypothetical protein
MLFLRNADQRLFDRFHIMDSGRLDCKGRIKEASCDIFNVSLSGLQVRLDKPLAVGDECIVTIGRRKDEEFVIHGRVCYTNECEGEDGKEAYASGLKFTPRSMEERTAIAKYINAAFMRECPIVSAPLKRAA